MPVRLLHTADWHIGKPFAHIQGDTAALLREARFEAVAMIAGLATERAVDALLVAGDVFDDEQVASSTIRKLLICLERFAGPCVLLPGNHDPGRPGGLWDRLAAHGQPDNVILATSRQAVPLRDGELVILPAPLTEKGGQSDPTAWFDDAETPSSAIRIGLAHGSMAGFLPEAAELAHHIDPGRAGSARLDYLALGDWHGALRVNQRTWYSGTPEADAFAGREAGNVLLVEIAGPGAEPQVTPVPVSRFDWRSAALTFAGEDRQSVAAAIDTRLGGMPSPERTLLRLDVDGSLDVAARVALDEAIEQWRARFRYVDMRDDRLATDTTGSNPAIFDDDGMLSQVAHALARQSGEGSEQDRRVAAMALRLLYTAHARLRPDA